jgi:hypothetical protein
VVAEAALLLRARGRWSRRRCVRGIRRRRWRLPGEHGGGGAVSPVCLRVKVEEAESSVFFQSANFFLHYNWGDGPVGPNPHMSILVVGLFATCPLS